jgi:CubicO group peptidase (beta-lactamase class C family)
MHMSAADKARVPAADLAKDERAECNANGGFRLTEVIKADPRSVKYGMRGLTSGTWFTMNLGVDSAGALSSLGFQPTTPPESSMPRDLSDAALASDLRSLVTRLATSGLFSGIVTVARDTQVIATATGGYANRERRTPFTDSSQFTLGSMGKMFTAASIGQLVDAGAVSFDDTVGKFFPTYPNDSVRRHVTVGMLLSHMGGLGDFLGKRTHQMMTEGVKRAAEFMPLYDSAPPKFVPGTDWSYSNAGLALAGAIVEQVSGVDYPDYIKQHVFTVAGMTHSDPNNVPHVTANLVTPYTHMSERGAPSAEWQEAEHDIGSPAGGAISTTHDLVRFAAALRDGRLEKPATFTAMTTPRHTFPTGESYGYAMEIHNVYGRTVVGHGGGFPGVSTHLYIFLGTPYTVVILSNQDPPADLYVGSTVAAWVAEKAKRAQRLAVVDH